MTNTTQQPDLELIFDIGMHRGEDTDYYLKRGFRVVAFEADPSLVEENKSRFANQLQNGDLIIVEGAIVEKVITERVKFYKNCDSSVWSTVDSEWAERNEKLGTSNIIIEVPAVDFADCLARYGIPYYMKIDIEGADSFCLQALRHFPSKPSYLSMESEKISYTKLLNELELLSGLGYHQFKAVQQANVPKMRVPSQSEEGKLIVHSFSKEASGLFGSDLPGEWVSRDEVSRIYKNIFHQYSKYGDSTIWQKNPFAARLLKLISRLTGKHFPGWYDTHARHQSLVD